MSNWLPGSVQVTYKADSHSTPKHVHLTHSPSPEQLFVFFVEQFTLHFIDQIHKHAHNFASARKMHAMLNAPRVVFVDKKLTVKFNSMRTNRVSPNKFEKEYSFLICAEIVFRYNEQLTLN